MLVASQFVFVHIPRTAGCFIRAAVEAHLELEPEAPRFPTHASYEELPDRFRERPGFCIVRNPWDWYVSWYHHTLKRGPQFAGLNRAHPKAAFWDAVFAGGESTFRETITRVCEGPIEHVFAENMRRRDTDLYSEYVRVLTRAAGRQERLEVGRFEQLVPFVSDFLDRRGLLTEPLRETLEQSPPVNGAERGPYREYYDSELRDLVGHKARWLTNEFDYTF